MIFFPRNNDTRAVKIIPKNSVKLSASLLGSLADLDHENIVKHIETFELVVPDITGFDSIYLCMVTELCEVNVFLTSF